MSDSRNNTKRNVYTIALTFLAIVFVGLFLYYDRHGSISPVLRSWGWPGVILAIIIMALLCMTPVPSESLLILYLKVYGVALGVFYAWLGSIVSTLIVFVVARYIGKPLLQSTISLERFEMIDAWVQKRGTQGLLIVRLLPIPGFIVSYVLGTMPSVRLWTFVWTAAVSVIPYYTGAALVYLGVSTRLVSWISIAIVVILVFWIAAHWIRKRWTRDGNPLS